jgi:hypothetical protein
MANKEKKEEQIKRKVKNARENMESTNKKVEK